MPRLIKFMNLEGNRFLPSSSGLNEHWLYVVYLKSDQVDWSVVQSGLRKIPRNGAGVQCGFGGKLLLSMHKTLGSLPWTTTCPDDSDVQPGLEITLWVVIRTLGQENLKLVLFLSPTPQAKWRWVCSCRLKRERIPWSGRDSRREMPKARFLDPGTFAAIPGMALGLKLTMSQSSDSSVSSQSRSGGKCYNQSSILCYKYRVCVSKWKQFSRPVL